MKKIIIATMFLVSLLGFNFVPASASIFGGAQEAACQGLNDAAKGQNPDATEESDACNAEEATSGVRRLIKVALQMLAFVIGIISVIMIIIGGIRYVTSNGDSASTKKAKDTIIYACVGLIIAVLAQVLVTFVVGRVSTSQNNSSTQNPDPKINGPQ